MVYPHVSPTDPTVDPLSREVYGSATDAMMLNGETHVTHAIGSRSRSALPVPYRDRLHRRSVGG